MNETQENSSFAFDEAIKVEYKGNVNGIYLYDGYCSEEWRVRSFQNGGTELCGVVIQGGIPI